MNWKARGVLIIAFLIKCPIFCSHLHILPWKCVLDIVSLNINSLSWQLIPSKISKGSEDFILAFLLLLVEWWTYLFFPPLISCLEIYAHVYMAFNFESTIHSMRTYWLMRQFQLQALLASLLLLLFAPKLSRCIFLKRINHYDVFFPIFSWLLPLVYAFSQSCSFLWLWMLFLSSSRSVPIFYWCMST